MSYSLQVRPYACSLSLFASSSTLTACVDDLEIFSAQTQSRLLDNQEAPLSASLASESWVIKRRGFSQCPVFGDKECWEITMLLSMRPSLIQTEMQIHIINLSHVARTH